MCTPGIVAVSLYVLSQTSRLRRLSVGFPLQGADFLLSPSISLCSIFLRDMVWLKWAPYGFGDIYPGFITFIKLQLLSVQETIRPTCYRTSRHETFSTYFCKSFG